MITYRTIKIRGKTFLRVDAPFSLWLQTGEMEVTHNTIKKA